MFSFRAALPQSPAFVRSVVHSSCLKYSISPTDDPIRFWRSKVKVIVDRGEGIHVDARGPSSSVSFYVRIAL